MKRGKFYLILIFGILIGLMLISSIDATSYCVSTSGSDANNGTCTTSNCSDVVGSEASWCWQSVQKADNGPYNPGDQILFKRGDTWRPTDASSVFSSRFAFPDSGNSTHQITLAAYGSGNLPVLDGSQNITNWALGNCSGTNDCYNVTLASGLTSQVFYNNTRLAEVSTCPTGITSGTFCQTGANLLVRLPDDSNPNNSRMDVSIHNSTILFAGQSYITIENMNLTKSNGQLLFANTGGSENLSINNSAFSWSGSNCVQIRSNYSNITNNVVNGCNDTGFQIASGTNLTVRNNTIYNNGVYGSGGNGIAVYCVNYGLCYYGNISNNTVYNVWGSGISFTGASDLVIEYNNLTNNYVNSGLGGGHIASFGNSSDVIVRFNTMKGGNISGLRLDAPLWGIFGANTTRIHNNLIWNINSSGVILEVDAKDTIVYSNTIYNNSKHCLQVGASDTYNTSDDTLNNTFMNNICYNNSYDSNDYAKKEFRIRPNAIERLNHSDYNLITPTTGGNFSIWNGTEYETLAEYQNASSQDNNSIEGDPLFADPDNGNFTLLAGSPAIDTGTYLTADFLKMDFNSIPIPQGTAPDMGAFELLNTTQTVYNYSNSVPGRVEAENYDTGGNGVAYNDTTAGNTGGYYRGDDVDIKLSNDSGETGTGYAIGFMAIDEWLEYTITVQSTGYYLFTFRVLSQLSGYFHAEIDSVDVTGSQLVPITGNWDTDSWTDIDVDNIYMTSGNHTLRFYVDSQYLDFNYIDIATSSGPTVNNGGGGGSGGGSLSYPTYYPTQEELKTGYEKALRKNWQIQFEFENENHTLTLEDLTGQIATINVTSDPIIFDLTADQTRNLDLNGDGFSDIEIYLKNITSTTFDEANLRLKLLVQENEEESSGGGGLGSLGGTTTKSKLRFWIIIILILIVAVTGVIVWKMIKKKREEEGDWYRKYEKNKKDETFK